MIGAGSQCGGEQIELHSTAFIIVWDIRANDSIALRRVQAKMRGHPAFALHSRHGRDDSSPSSSGISQTADVAACACLPARGTKPGRRGAKPSAALQHLRDALAYPNAQGAQGVATAGAATPRHGDFSLNWVLPEVADQCFGPRTERDSLIALSEGFSRHPPDFRKHSCALALRAGALGDVSRDDDGRLA